MLHTTDYLYNLRHAFSVKVRRMAVYVLILIGVIAVILRFFSFPVKVGSASMQQDFLPGNLVFVTPLPFAGTERGDVVLLKAKGGPRDSAFLARLDAIAAFFTLGRYSTVNPEYLTSHSPTLSRIAALPGDRIYMRDNILYVRPSGASSYVTEFELSKNHYNITTRPIPSGWHNDIGVPVNFSEITLGPKEFYILSDDRSSSFDSRFLGPLRESDIIGKVWLRYFPLRRLALF